VVTIKDIAKKAGVSVTTVSRALNNYDDVSDITKKRIIKIAKKLDYVPNRTAQNLVKQQNNTLAIIVSELEEDGGKDNIIYKLLSGMYYYAETINYEVVLFTMSTAHQKEKSYVQFCREHNIGGAVLNGVKTDDPYLMELVNSEFPCVLIDVTSEGENVSSISIDNIKASMEMVDLLIENNHRNIAMINGKKKVTVSEERYKGYTQALEKNNIKVNNRYVTYTDFSEEMAYEKAVELLNKCPEITAFFCASDMIALGTMKAMRAMGKEIPKDISITGFDNIPFAAELSPPLTTIGQDFYVMGKRAAEQLFRMISKEKWERKIYLDYKVLVRDSVNMIQ
jgi:DNA-binding LacI/PurR family transcriptional regulator